jgi:hypothetical protein
MNFLSGTMEEKNAYFQSSESSSNWSDSYGII